MDSEQMRSGFSLEVKEEPKSQQTKRSSDNSGYAKLFGGELSCKRQSLGEQGGQIRRGSPREGWGCDSEDGQTDTGLGSDTDMELNAHHSPNSQWGFLGLQAPGQT